MPTTITPKIINLNAIVTKAPVPSQLQQSGALISIGGTSLAPNAYQFCGTLSAVTALLGAVGNFAEVNDMATTFFAQGTAVGCYVLELGLITGIDAQISALETWIANNPNIFYSFLVPANWDFSKDEVGGVTVTNGGSGYISVPTVTFAAPVSGVTATGTANIANGSVISVTMTNSGNGYTAQPIATFSPPTAGVTATGTSYLVSGLDYMASQYAAPTGKTYFFVTTSVANVTNYSTQKSVYALVPSPTQNSAEFQAASNFYQFLVNLPGQSNRLAPMAYRYLYGVTPWAQNSANNTNVNTILTSYGNVILTGAEGGISNALIMKGTTMDGEQLSWWYGIDWFQIQVKQALAAAIINGSNKSPPLLYDQGGINTLQAVAQQVANSAVKFGCALSAVVSAIPFYTYTTDNPNDYNNGIYNGLSAVVVGQNGFLTLNFVLDAVQFVV